MLANLGGQKSHGEVSPEHNLTFLSRLLKGQNHRRRRLLFINTDLFLLSLGTDNSYDFFLSCGTGGKSIYTRATTGSVAFQKVVNGGSRVICTGSGAGKRISFAPDSLTCLNSIYSSVFKHQSELGQARLYSTPQLSTFLQNIHQLLEVQHVHFVTFFD